MGFGAGRRGGEGETRGGGWEGVERRREGTGGRREEGSREGP